MTIELWTVTQLTVGMDSLWTAQFDWTKSCPQPDHTHLGQVIVWSTDFSTAAWITARLVIAVTHTAHSFNSGSLFFIKKTGKEKSDDHLALFPNKNSRSAKNLCARCLTSGPKNDTQNKIVASLRRSPDRHRWFW